jgi:hypothetical protein
VHGDQSDNQERTLVSRVADAMLVSTLSQTGNVAANYPDPDEKGGGFSSRKIMLQDL